MIARFLEKLAEWGINPADQIAPHRPDNFVVPFPEQANEQFLTENVWWWRYADVNRDFTRIFPIWNEQLAGYSRSQLTIFLDHHQPSAFFYEFRARYNDRYSWDFGLPWIRCTDEQWRFLGDLVPSKRPSKLCLGLDREEDTWVTLPKFNLRMNDSVLVETFLAEINRMRTALRVDRPGLGRGVPRRPFPWKPLELMDVRHYGMGPLNESERGQLSKAHRQYEATCQEIGLEP